MSELVRDDQHRYWLGKRRLQGVTTILSALNFTNYDGPWFTKEALERGSILHDCIQMVNEDDDYWKSVDQDILVEVEAYAEWKEKTGFKPLLVEEMMYSELYSFAGTPDAFGVFPGGNYALPDWKRGVPEKAVRFQLAFYVLLVCEHYKRLGEVIYPHQIGRYTLGSIGTGKPKMICYDDRNDIRAAQSIVASYHSGVNAGIFQLN